MRLARDVTFGRSVRPSKIILLVATVFAAMPGVGQAAMSATDSSRATLEQLGGLSGTERYRILYSLKTAGRIAPGLTVADLNAIMVGMEDQRVRVVDLMKRDLVANMRAADVVALSGQTTGSDRYAILYDLKSENRISPGLTVADLNSIMVGMEDQRVRVVDLMKRDLVANMRAADVVALSGQTTGSDRYAILYDLKSENRISPGLTVADLNSIMVGMEDQRVRVVDLMKRDLVANMRAADVVALSGQTSGSSRYAILYDLKTENRIAHGLTVADLNAIIAGMEDQRVRVVKLMREHLASSLTAADVATATGGTGSSSNPLDAAKATCGSGFIQRFFIPDYVCFNSNGQMDSNAVNCAAKKLRGYEAVYFGEACRAHDQCYGQAGSVRSTCDSAFRTLLGATCDETLSDPAWSAARSTCWQQANTWYRTLQARGCEAFKAAQTAVGNAGATCK